jgi:hypothetical protein
MLLASSGSHELFGPVLRAVDLNMIILLYAQHYYWGTVLLNN